MSGGLFVSQLMGSGYARFRPSALLSVPLSCLCIFCRAVFVLLFVHFLPLVFLFSMLSAFSVSIFSLSSVPICAVTMEHLPCGVHLDLPRNEFIQKLLHLSVPDLLRLRSQLFLEASTV